MNHTKKALKIEFERLTREIEDHFKKRNVSQEDVAEAVKWTRKKQ